MQMKSICGSVINQEEDFKYIYIPIGSYIRSTIIYINIKIARVWAAVNSMTII